MMRNSRTAILVLAITLAASPALGAETGEEETKSWREVGPVMFFPRLGIYFSADYLPEYPPDKHNIIGRLSAEVALVGFSVEFFSADLYLKGAASFDRFNEFWNRTWGTGGGIRLAFDFKPFSFHLFGEVEVGSSYSETDDTGKAVDAYYDYAIPRDWREVFVDAIFGVASWGEYDVEPAQRTFEIAFDFWFEHYLQLVTTRKDDWNLTFRGNARLGMLTARLGPVRAGLYFPVSLAVAIQEYHWSNNLNMGMGIVFMYKGISLGFDETVRFYLRAEDWDAFHANGRERIEHYPNLYLTYWFGI